MALGAAGPKSLSASDAVDGVINVPDTGGAPVTVVGNGQVPVKVWFYSNWTHKLSIGDRNSVVVEEQHATGQKTTMTNVPALYFLDGNGVSLPSLKPLDGPPPSLAQGNIDGPAIIHAPSLPKPSRPGEIVAVQVRNDGADNLPSRVVTFGQAFVQGDFPEGAVLEAKAGNDPIPAQADIKVRYADKSVRHAVVSLQVPALARSASLTVMLSVRQGSASTAPIAPNTILSKGYDLSLIREFPADSGLPPLSLDAGRLLASAASDGSLTTWLSGPLATEYRISKRIVPNLLATFDIRALGDGSVMTDVSVANDFALMFPQTSIYSATVTQAGMPSWKTPLLVHRRFQEWHKVFWSNDARRPSLVLDVDYLERAGAIPNYDLSSGLSRKTLEDYRKALGAADTGPLGAALITKQMGTTGGRPDIGPTTTWAANYLVSQDPDARSVMLAQADAAASIPWHVREADGRMITTTTHPRLWLDNRCKSADCLPGGFTDANNPTGWEQESAHEPDLAYVPYLTTGSHFYLDQLQAEANWTIASHDPDYRSNEKGLLYPLSQVRGTAWNLRDIGNAAWITPDTDPLKTYFATILSNNFGGLKQTYLVERSMRDTGAIEGFILNPFDETSVGPWQQDFLALVAAQEAVRGLDPAKNFAAWMENFNAGRFLHRSDGYNPLRGPAYYLVYLDPHTKRPLNSWASLYDLNFAGKPAPTALEGSPGGNGDYAAVARAATAGLFSLTQAPRALRAYAFIVAHSEGMLRDFPNSNSFNINPRFSDGHLLQNDEIQYAPPSGGRVQAKTAHSLLVGGDAQVTLQGAKGVSIFVGGNGTSTLIGAPGVNYFFVDSGNTTLAGAAGQNYFGLGTGRAQIDLAASDAAVDRIEGFKPGSDHIHLIGLDADLGKAVASARRNGAGMTVLTIGSAHTIELIGIAPDQVSPIFFN